MSKERKSFLLHFDSLGILDQLTREQRGDLLLACRDFNLGKELELDTTLELVFFPFKAQFLRDQEKYQTIVERNKANGSKGGRPKNPEEPKEPSGLFGNPDEPRKADSDSDSVNGSGSDIKPFVDRKRSQPIPYQEFVDLYNNQLGNEFGRVLKADSDVKIKVIKKAWKRLDENMNRVGHYFYFYHHHVTDHQKGLGPPNGNKPFKATFAFICRPDIMEPYLDLMDAE